MQQDHTYMEVMEKLLDAGADPNVRLTKHLWFMSFNFDLLQIDAKGATPFWRAAYALDVEAMKLLVAHGADPSIPTEKVPSRRFGRGGGEEADHSGLPPVPVGGAAVHPIHAASGVGYGQGFAGNAHRHVPGAWIPAVRYLVEELGAGHRMPATRTDTARCITRPRAATTSSSCIWSNRARMSRS